MNKDPVIRPHSGKWEYHDDDCWCIMGRDFCNRDGHVWSCCGACKKDSDCSAPNTHPTYWNHKKHTQTIDRYNSDHRPIYKSNKEIRKIAPECFQALLENPGIDDFES